MNILQGKSTKEFEEIFAGYDKVIIALVNIKKRISYEWETYSTVYLMRWPGLRAF
jgi:hypothetical protein